MHTKNQRRKIPDKPRFRYAAQKAHDLLIELGINRFPISTDVIIDELDYKFRILSYSQAKEILKTDDPFHLHQTHSEARTIKIREQDTAMIIYDDTLNVPNSRIRWSIVHEIGHIMLGHLDDFENTSLNRGGITDSEYGVLEVEAHHFASEFLMPTPILKALENINVESIISIFDVSDEAARKKYDSLNIDFWPAATITSELLYRNFYDFIHPESFCYVPEEESYDKFSYWNYIKDKISPLFEEDVLRDTTAYEDEDNLILYTRHDPFTVRLNEVKVLALIKKYTKCKFNCMVVRNIPGGFHLDSTCVKTVECNKSIKEMLESDDFPFIEC